MAHDASREGKRPRFAQTYQYPPTSYPTSAHTQHPPPFEPSMSIERRDGLPSTTSNAYAQEPPAGYGAPAANGPQYSTEPSDFARSSMNPGKVSSSPPPLPPSSSQSQRRPSVPMINGHEPAHPMSALYSPHEASLPPVAQSLSARPGAHSLTPINITHPPNVPSGMQFAPSPSSAHPARDAFYTTQTTYPVSSKDNSKRRAARAAQACEACRTRKAKCDEGRPACSFCQENKQECKYRVVQPPKSDRNIAYIMGKLDQLQTTLNLIVQGSVPGLSPEIKEQLLKETQSVKPVEQISPRLQRVANDEPQSTVSTTFQQVAEDGIDPYSNPDENSYVKEETEEEDNSPGELTIPVEHTTAAHKLLRWPSIRDLVHEVTNDENYVLREEENRGILRLYGRGEGRDTGEFNFVNGDSGSSDEEANALTPWPFSHGVWGIGYAIPGSAQKRKVPYDSAGGLNPDGSLKLDSETLWELLGSFQKHIYVMHPFMGEASTEYIFRQFDLRYNQNGPGPALFANQQPRGNDYPMMPPESRDARDLNPGIKRKRSEQPSTAKSKQKPKDSTFALERSVTTAIVLLVLALGKICQHGDWLPGPVQTSTKPNQGFSPATSSSTESPGSTKHSPPTPAHSSTGSRVAAPTHDITNRRASIDKQASLMNVDVIPGLAYYAYACEILGSIIGGNDLPHVQAFLLAGLYAGQLCRVIESWKWINIACTACQLTIQPVLSKKSSLDAERRDAITVAFWTCLQLESDILAELDFPPSGISRYEEKMSLPELVAAKGRDPEHSDNLTLMGLYYLAQIALRKLLNRVHTFVYDKAPGGKLPGSGQPGYSMPQLLEFRRQLEAWRQALPVALQWTDGEDPPKDINAARLRAKYHGAQYIIHRPFLHHTIHPIAQHSSISRPSLTSPPSLSQGSPPTAQQQNGHKNIIPGQSESFNGLDDEVKDACQTCVIAAMNSTRAFDGIPGRPIVTNIFGTIHAQFGNLLVLNAAWRTPPLTTTINEYELEMMLQQVMTRFRHLSRLSPALRIDTMILEQCLKKFLEHPKVVENKNSQARSFTATPGLNHPQQVQVA